MAVHFENVADPARKVATHMIATHIAKGRKKKEGEMNSQFMVLAAMDSDRQRTYRTPKPVKVKEGVKVPVITFPLRFL